MRRLVTAFIAAAILTAPSHAAGWQGQESDVRRGAFLGAQISIPLGGQARSRPFSQLAIAPMTVASDHRRVSAFIGQGLALRIGREAKPSIMIGGVRADHALGLNRSKQVQAEQKMGLSTGGWIAIGLATAIGVGFLIVANHCEDHSGTICGDDE